MPNLPGSVITNTRQRIFSPKPSATVLILAACVLSIATVAVSAVTLEQLRNDAALTPQKFATYFEQFDFRFRPDVQSPEIFLSSQCGDCDDYATLASEIFKCRGFSPRLITVRMKGIVHVVCFLPEAGRYLDYSQRKAAEKAIVSDGTLKDIAQKVAKTFKKRWTSVSEFTFEDGRKRLVKTVVEGEEKHAKLRS